MKTLPMNIAIGKIVHIELTPMTDGLLSLITISVYLHEINSLIDVFERGTIDDLKRKFDFDIEDNAYLLKRMEGRLCRIGIDRKGFYFLSYVF